MVVNKTWQREMFHDKKKSLIDFKRIMKNQKDFPRKKYKAKQ